MNTPQTSNQYANFTQRLIAMIIDNVLFAVVMSPIFLMLFEQPSYTDAEMQEVLRTQGIMGLMNPKEMLFQQAFLFAITVFFWTRYAGTPGKLWLGIKVVDATTGKNLSPLQSVVRYLGYFIASLPMGLGFFWMLWDGKRQGWHDKFAHSVVIKTNAAVLPIENHPPRQSSHSDNDTFQA